MTTPARSADKLSEPTPATGAEAAAWMKQNGHWLLLLIPYAFASWVPLTWAWDWWGNPRSPVFLQPFVPFLAAALAWSRREELKAARRATEGARSFWVRGNYIPLVLGCLLLLVAHIVHIKGVALFALWLIAMGAVYQMYGVRVLKAAWVPILFSLLVIPAPDSLLVALSTRSLRGVSAVASSILDLFTTSSVDPRGFLRLDKWGYSVEFRESMSPTVTILPALTLGLWYVLYRRFHWKQAVTFLIAITGAAIVVSLLLAVAVALISGQKREFGDLLQFFQPIMPALLTTPTGWAQLTAMLGIAWGTLLLSFGAALMITRPRVNSADRLARPTGAVANRLGQGIGLIFSPLVALLDGIGKLGKVFKNVNRGTENLLARVFRKKKKNRGW